MEETCGSGKVKESGSQHILYCRTFLKAKLSIAWLHVKGQGTTPAGSHWVSHVILCAYIILMMPDYAVTFWVINLVSTGLFNFNGLKSRVKALPPWNTRQKVKRLVLLCVALKLPYANVGLFYLVQIWYPLKSYLLNFFLLGCFQKFWLTLWVLF